MATNEKELAERWVGHTVKNSDLPAFIRKNGAPVHTKPHAPDSTIVYYENPDYKPDGGKLEKAAWPGETVATRGVVEHFAHAGTEFRSASAGRPVAAASGGVAKGNPPPGNPNDATRTSEIKGDADKKVLKEEAEKAATNSSPALKVEVTDAKDEKKEKVEVPKVSKEDPAVSPSSDKPSPIANPEAKSDAKKS